MLDYGRLETNALLVKAGWTVEHRNLLQKSISRLDPRFPPQVPECAIFESARDIIDALNGICIRNQCPCLGVSKDTNAIEFDFFNYDVSVYSELRAVCTQIGWQAVYIGIGYDIIGDWIVDEEGKIYFQNRRNNKLSLFSMSIYDFLEKDIYKYTDLFGKSIFTL